MESRQLTSELLRYQSRLQHIWAVGPPGSASLGLRSALTTQITSTERTAVERLSEGTQHCHLGTQEELSNASSSNPVNSKTMSPRPCSGHRRL